MKIIGGWGTYLIPAHCHQWHWWSLHCHGSGYGGWWWHIMGGVVVVGDTLAVAGHCHLISHMCLVMDT